MSLRTTVLGALGWAVGGKAVAQVLSWAITLVVVRLLSPADYGIMAIASAFVALITMITEMGFGSALVQASELTDVLIRKAFGLILVVALLATGTLIAVAGNVATFFEEPTLQPVVTVLSLLILVSAFSIVPTAVLSRNLDFKNQSIVVLISTIAGSLVALILAVRGFGVWALVWSQVAVFCLKGFGLTLVARPPLIPSFNFKGLKSIASFGSWLTLERIAWTLAARSDALVIGKLLGNRVLGLYEVGLNLASMPQTKVQGVINSVAFSAFSKIREDPGAADAYLMKYLRISLLLASPVFFGLAVTGPDIVNVVLGAKWAEASVPLAIIALAMPLKLVEAAIAPYLQAIGKVRTSFGNVFIGLLLMIVAMIAGAKWGLLGVSVAWDIAMTATVVVTVYRTCRVTNLNPTSLAVTVIHACIPALIMYASLKALGQVMHWNGSLTALLAMIPSGAGVYALALWLTCRKHVIEMSDMFGLRMPRLLH